MQAIEWNDSYSLDITEVDNHHKELFSLINQVAQAIDQDLEDEQFGIIIGELNRYTIYHFTYEEKLFDKYGYKDSEKHKESHRYFIDKIQELSNNYCIYEKDVSFKLLIFLFDWLVNHIQKADSQYAPIIKD